MSKLDYNSIRLPEEIELSAFLNNALPCESILHLAEVAKYSLTQREQKMLQSFEQDCFWVTAESSPRYYRIFSDVVERLGFEEPLRFYIKACAEPNAFCVLSPSNLPHAIVIHSSTLQLMNDDEIRQIVGHEIGHLIIRQGKIFPILNTFSNQINANPSLCYKVRLWQQLSELSADRFGFLAVPDLTVRISSGIKFSAGMPLEQLIDDYNIDYPKFLERSLQTVSRFQQHYGVYEDAHPDEDFRLAALHIFSESHWFKKAGLSDEALNQKTNELLQGLYNVAENEMEVVKARFYASAGLLIAGCDATINQDELDYIYAKISEHQIFPKQYFEAIAQEDYVSIFEESVERLLQEHPDDMEFKEKMLHRLIQIGIADQNMRAIETDVILHYAQTLLGFSKQKAAAIILNALHEHFMPNPEDIL